MGGGTEHPEGVPYCEDPALRRVVGDGSELTSSRAGGLLRRRGGP